MYLDYAGPPTKCTRRRSEPGSYGEEIATKEPFGVLRLAYQMTPLTCMSRLSNRGP